MSADDSRRSAPLCHRRWHGCCIHSVTWQSSHATDEGRPAEEPDGHGRPRSRRRRRAGSGAPTRSTSPASTLEATIVAHLQAAARSSRWAASSDSAHGRSSCIAAYELLLMHTSQPATPCRDRRHQRGSSRSPSWRRARRACVSPPRTPAAVDQPLMATLEEREALRQSLAEHKRELRAAVHEVGEAARAWTGSRRFRSAVAWRTWLVGARRRPPGSAEGETTMDDTSTAAKRGGYCRGDEPNACMACAKNSRRSTAASAISVQERFRSRACFAAPARRPTRSHASCDARRRR